MQSIKGASTGLRPHLVELLRARVGGSAGLSGRCIAAGAGLWATLIDVPVCTDQRAGADQVCSRLKADPRRQTVEHVFGTLKAWLGTTPLLTKTLPRVRPEVSLAVLAYNMKRMIMIRGTQVMVQAIGA